MKHSHKDYRKQLDSIRAGDKVRIAIMQPYFIPYAGYFRLFQSTDLFVVYDCVQFIRRGWVHRNKILDTKNELSWFTLPLAKAPQEIKIADLKFTEDSKSRMQELMRKFPIFSSKQYLTSELSRCMLEFSQSPVYYLTSFLKLICHLLEIPCNIIYSSDLKLPVDLTGQDRIIAIAKHFKASEYINAPGGRELYEEAVFRQHNIKLQFLPDYAVHDSAYHSILPRLLQEDNCLLKKEIIDQSI